ncbi:hypothetical protein STRAU_4823 [Streptomyces aurantiacus JA 4570]|uniref:Uncharacterized protein n=1 Tax=Streptomyces aurantiacus JA 4570 TaxID=1286094 RepID=S3ZEN7_9ACTN|nr:hypothetical protein STRAU_4823 [Streptomyces aurantiacus JA 4570]
MAREDRELDKAPQRRTSGRADETRERRKPATTPGGGDRPKAAGRRGGQRGYVEVPDDEFLDAEALDADEGMERRPLWVEEPATRRRLPDPVRTAAVRAVLIVSLTLIQAMTAFFCAMAESWLAFPMVLSSVAGTIVATWAVCDVWVTRQVWNQRNGVVSVPSSTARRLRRERRKARRDARVAARAKEGIRNRGGAGQLSHS